MRPEAGGVSWLQNPRLVWDHLVPPTMAFAAPAGGGNGPGHCAVAELWCLRETGQSASVKCAWMCSQAVFGFKKREIQIVQNPRVAQAEVLCSKCDLSASTVM